MVPSLISRANHPTGIEARRRPQRILLRRWLRFKHKTRRSQGGSYPLRYLYETCGLVRLTRLRRDVPWTKAWGLVREPDAGKSACPVR
jgi:hypothetical protein